MKEITVTYCQRFRDIGSKTSDVGRPEKAVSKLHTCIFQLQGSDILIGALHFLSLRPMNQEKRIALFRKWAIRFQKNTLHFFQKGVFVFLQTLIKW